MKKAQPLIIEMKYTQSQEKNEQKYTDDNT